MKTSRMDSKSIMLRNGLYLGLTTVIVGVVIYAMGLTFSGNMVVGIANTGLWFISMLLFIVLGISQFKKEKAGFLTLREALKVGIGIALIGAIISIIYSLIFSTVIEPNFNEKVLELQREKMLEMNPNLSSDQLENAIEVSRKLMSPLFTIPVTIMWNLFLGLIISLIAGAVMQKKETSL